MGEDINVLVAEDDFMVAKITREFTERISGFNVTAEVRDGREALITLDETDIDLIVMDVYMPELDGLELLQQIRRENRDIDVIMVTAAKETKTIRQCLRLGVFDYLIKPFVFERYQQALTDYHRRIQKFHQSEMNQEILDLIFGIVPGALNGEDLPKGLQQITLNRIVKHFQIRSVAQGIDEIAQETGLSNATVQRYLRYLTETEQVEKQLIYGTKGRPEHKFTSIRNV